MVSAKILKGKRATAVWNIQIDLENAGATVLDEPCVIDGNLISGKHPAVTDRFMDLFLTEIEKVG